MRPAYHISHPRGIGWPFDPNFAIHWKGRYHLMWIQGAGRGWAHASSTDLIHWKMHPELDLFGCSGNAFLNMDGNPVVIGGTGQPGISIASSVDDELSDWKLFSTKTAGDPGDPDGNMYDIWDPFGWCDGKNYYAIFGCHPHRSKPASVWKSSDMKKWHYLGPLLSREMPGVDEYEDVSCPDLFKLGDKHVLLCIAHVKGARYYVGELRNGQFHPERHARMNWPAGACFAPETLKDDEGRRIMWAWAMDTHHCRKQEADQGWAGILTMPRVLSLAHDGTLLIKPIEEYELLRNQARKEQNIDVVAGEDRVLRNFGGDCIELNVEAKPGSEKAFGIKVRRSPNGEEETAIIFDPQKKLISIDLRKSSLDESIRYPTYVQCYNGLNGTPEENPKVTAQSAPFELRSDEDLQLRVFIDRSIMEVFVNDRQCVTQRIFPTRADSIGVALFSSDGKAVFSSVEAWDMAPIKMLSLSPSQDGQGG